MKSQVLTLSLLTFSPSLVFAGEETYSGSKRLVASQGKTHCVHEHNYDYELRHPPYRLSWGPDFSSTLTCTTDKSTVTVVSPPFKWFGAVGEHFIGLSNLKWGNAKQFSIVSNKGVILAEGHVSSDELCFSSDEWNIVREKDSFFKSIHPLLVTRRSDDKVFVDYFGYFWGLGPVSEEMYKIIVTNRCQNHLYWHQNGLNFVETHDYPTVSESKINYIHWYDESSPEPEVVQEGGRVNGILIRLLGHPEKIYVRAQYLWLIRQTQRTCLQKQGQCISTG